MEMENNLPENWELINLVEDLNFLPTGVLKYEGFKKYFSTGSIQDSNYIPEGEFDYENRPSRANREVKLNDVLQARMKNTDKGILIDKHLNGQLFSTGFIQLRSYADTYNSKLLYYLIKSDFFLNQKNDYATGSTQEALTDDGAKKIEIPLPPLPEQHRIVAKLDALFEKIESNKQRLDKIPKLLKRFRQSVLAAAVSGKLTDLDEEIEKVPLGELIDDLKYGTSQKSEKESSGTPILRIPNIGLDGKINSDDLKFAVLPNNELEKLKLEEGDILLIRSNGSVSLLGRAAIVSDEQKGFAYAGYLIRVRCNRKRLLPEFLIHILSSYDIRMQIELPSRSSSGVNNINSNEVKALEIPYFNLEEQTEIVRRVEQLFAFADKIEARYIKAKTILDKLPQSILAKAFRGELMAQDPNDESASVLLERIKLEKGKLAAEKKGKKQRT